jgi:site-specific recombinase XerD
MREITLLSSGVFQIFAGNWRRRLNGACWRPARTNLLSLASRDNNQNHGEPFRQSRLDEGDSPAAVSKKLRELKRLFQLGVERRQLDENPFKYIKLLKVPKQKIRIYTAEECGRIIRSAFELQNESVLEWDLVVTLALTTGM